MFAKTCQYLLMKTILVPLLALFVATGAITPEEKSTGGDKKKKPYAGGRKADDGILLVKNYSYVKKFHPKGKGDYLEVIFDIENRADKPLELKMYTMAFHEKNAIVPIERYWKGYPNWRTRDWDAEKVALVFYKSWPVIGKTMDEMRSGDNTYQSDFLTFLNHVESNPDQGIAFTLMGAEETVPLEKRIIREADYNILMERLRTTVSVRFLSEYRADQKFFTHFGVMLYDTAAKKVIYREFHHFRNTFKVR